MPSRPGRVYFASAAQLVYAAIRHRKGPGWIFEVSMPDEALQSGNLGPDEDSIGSTIGRDQGWWKPAAMTDAMIMKIKQLIAAIDVAQYAGEWAEYLERTGGISYDGTVPPDFIVRYARIEVHAIPEVLTIWSDFNTRSYPGDPKTCQPDPSTRK